MGQWMQNEGLKHAAGPSAISGLCVALRGFGEHPLVSGVSGVSGLQQGHAQRYVGRGGGGGPVLGRAPDVRKGCFQRWPFQMPFCCRRREHA